MYCKCIINKLNLYIDGLVGPYASHVNSSLNYVVYAVRILKYLRNLKNL